MPGTGHGGRLTTASPAPLRRPILPLTGKGAEMTGSKARIKPEREDKEWKNIKDRGLIYRAPQWLSSSPEDAAAACWN